MFRSPLTYHHYMPTATPRKTTSTTTRKRRSRKATAPKTAVKTVSTPIKEVKKVTVKTPVRPSTLLKTEDYINDIKIRFEIHNYEVNALINDIKWGYKQVSDYVVTIYKQEFAK